jgi:hypothetical protein
MVTHLENLPFPLFAKEGFCPSLWQREVRWDFMNCPLNYELTNVMP